MCELDYRKYICVMFRTCSHYEWHDWRRNRGNVEHLKMHKYCQEGQCNSNWNWASSATLLTKISHSISTSHQTRVWRETLGRNVPTKNNHLERHILNSFLSFFLCLYVRISYTNKTKQSTDTLALSSWSSPCASFIWLDFEQINYIILCVSFNRTL